MSRDRSDDFRERDHFLGFTFVTHAELDKWLDEYNRTHGPYHLITNNCWHFSRHFIQRLGFNPFTLPNPTGAFNFIGAFFGMQETAHWIVMAELENAEDL